MSQTYEPDKGDIVWLDFDPQTGHEQSGRRPALIISPKIYNQKSGLALICPITSKLKPYPYIVIIPDELEIKGVVLSDQIKNLDWTQRNAKFICKMPSRIVNEVIEKLNTLLGHIL